MIIAGQKKGIKKIIVPEANLKEAGPVSYTHLTLPTKLEV